MAQVNTLSTVNPTEVNSSNESRDGRRRISIADREETLDPWNIRKKEPTFTLMKQSLFEIQPGKEMNTLKALENSHEATKSDFKEQEQVIFGVKTQLQKTINDVRPRDIKIETQRSQIPLPDLVQRQAGNKITNLGTIGSQRATYIGDSPDHKKPKLRPKFKWMKDFRERSTLNRSVELSRKLDKSQVDWQHERNSQNNFT